MVSATKRVADRLELLAYQMNHPGLTLQECRAEIARKLVPPPPPFDPLTCSEAEFEAIAPWEARELLERYTAAGCWCCPDNQLWRADIDAIDEETALATTFERQRLALADALVWFFLKSWAQVRTDIRWVLRVFRR